MEGKTLKRGASEDVEDDRGGKQVVVEQEGGQVGRRMTLPIRLAVLVRSATPESDGSGDEEDYHVGSNVAPRLALRARFNGRDIGDVLPTSLQPMSWNDQEKQWEKRPVSEWRNERLEALLTLAVRTESEAQFVQLLKEKVAVRPKKRNDANRWVADDQRPITVKEIVAVADELPFAAEELAEEFGEEELGEGDSDGGEFE